MMNLLRKISNISLKKTIIVSLILGAIKCLFDLLVYDYISFLGVIIAVGIPIFIFFLQLNAKIILFVIGRIKSAKNNKSDFFKTQEIEDKEKLQKETGKKVKDLEEDLFD